MVRVLVSACLMGERVRYDGAKVPCNSAILKSWKHDGLIVTFCPEVAGNLPVPRPPAEIFKGTGEDVIEGKSCYVAEGLIEPPLEGFLDSVTTVSYTHLTLPTTPYV